MVAVLISRTDKLSLLQCRGRIIAGPALAALRAAVVSRRDTQIVVELADVQTVDAAGVTLLADLHHWASEHGKRIQFTNPRTEVRLAMQVGKVEDVFDHWAPDSAEEITRFSTD